MNKQKAKIIGCAALTLLIGFAGGMATRDLCDKQNSAKANEVAAEVPVHKMPPATTTTTTTTTTTNRLIAPNLWNVVLDPLFIPVTLDIPPVGLPDFVSLPMDVPAVQTVNGAHELQIVAQLPGLTDKDIDVQVGDDALTIKGEKKQETRNNKAFSTVSESFVRTVQLPCKVDGDHVKATLKNGILTVSLPKREHIADNK